MEVVRSEKVREFQFVPRIKGAREVKKMTAARFASLASSMKGKPEFTLQEYFKGDTMVHPYYDLDAKYKKVLAGDELSAEKKKHFSDFTTLMEKLHPGKDVEYAERHGQLQNAGDYLWKISYRAFVMGVKCPASYIPKYARAVLGLGPKDVHPVLDFSVYKDKEQLLGVIFGCKDIDVVKRFLTPLDKATSPSKFLAQNFDETDVDLRDTALPGNPVVNSATPAKKRGRPPKSAKALPTPTTTGDIVTHEESVVKSEALEGPKYVDALSDASDFFGEKYRMTENFTKIVVRADLSSVIFPTTLKGCYIGWKRKDGKNSHVSNNPYVTVTERGARYKCPDEAHKDVETPFIPLADLPKSVQEVFNTAIYGSRVQEDDLSEAKEECRRQILKNFPDEEDGVEILQPVQQLSGLVTRSIKQRCKKCGSTVEFSHMHAGWCLKCINVECGMQFPDEPAPINGDRYPKLMGALNNLQVNVVNIQGNVTVNNNTFLAGEVDFYADYNNDGIAMFEDPVENELFIGSLNGTDTTLSRFATYHFRDQFHCTLEKKWFFYDKHCWSEGSADLVFKEALGKPEFLRYYQQVALYFENQPIQNDDTKRKAKLLRKLCTNLEDGKQREKIVTDSIVKLHDFRPKFTDELNTQNVMVFEDGVYDFESFSFGPGTPDRAITMKVPQRYVPYDIGNPHVAFLLNFFEQVLPDPDVRKYFLKILGVALTTNTSQQQFYILTGSGGNGKGKVMTLVEECLGDYYQAIPTALLTRVRESANQANEGLMLLAKARCAVAQEANPNDILQASFIKTVTGEDTMSTRQNYGHQIKFRSKAKLFLVVNDIPKVSEDNHSVWRRIRVINFPVSFVDKPRPDRPFERKVDYDLDRKLKAAAPYFLPILIEHYRMYTTEGLRVPKIVQEVTDKYKDGNDILKEFITEKLVRDENGMLRWTDLFGTYNSYGKKYENKLRRLDLIKALEGHGLHYIDTDIKEADGTLAKFKGYRGWRLGD